MTTLADYQAWRRSPGGFMHSAAYPSEAEAVGEIQRTVSADAIQDMINRHKITYGRELSVTQARTALDHGWERGQGFSGTSGELQSVTQRMFPGQFVIRARGESLDDRVRTGADLVHPVTSPAASLPPGVAGL